MPFSKAFPKTTKTSVYPKWEDIFLTEEEEREQENLLRKDNLALMHECIDDARKIIDSQGLKRFQSDLIRMAIALFEKRASYAIHYKERKAKEKFDEMGE